MQSFALLTLLAAAAAETDQLTERGLGSSHHNGHWGAPPSWWGSSSSSSSKSSKSSSKSSKSSGKSSKSTSSSSSVDHHGHGHSSHGSWEYISDIFYLNIAGSSTDESVSLLEKVTKIFLQDNIGNPGTFKVVDVNIVKSQTVQDTDLWSHSKWNDVGWKEVDGTSKEATVFKTDVTFAMESGFKEWVEKDNRHLGSNRRMQTSRCNSNEYAKCCAADAINNDRDKSKWCRQRGCSRNQCKRRPRRNNGRMMKQLTIDEDLFERNFTEIVNEYAGLSADIVSAAANDIDSLSDAAFCYLTRYFAVSPPEDSTSPANFEPCTLYNEYNDQICPLIEDVETTPCDSPTPSCGSGKSGKSGCGKSSKSGSGESGKSGKSGSGKSGKSDSGKSGKSGSRSSVYGWSDDGHDDKTWSDDGWAGSGIGGSGSSGKSGKSGRRSGSGDSSAGWTDDGWTDDELDDKSWSDDGWGASVDGYRSSGKSGKGDSRSSYWLRN